jgi:hypothetical protein
MNLTPYVNMSRFTINNTITREAIPEIFVMENVPSILTVADGLYYKARN